MRRNKKKLWLMKNEMKLKKLSNEYIYQKDEKNVYFFYNKNICSYERKNDIISITSIFFLQKW
jgi:hypothetical protein